MATGSGIPQQSGVVTSDITPTYSIPHDNAISEALAAVGDAAQGAINNVVKQHYETVGAKEGAAVAAGTKAYEKHIVITDVGRAREAAFQGSYLASMKTTIDDHVDQAARDNANDPAGFKKAAQEITSGFVSKAPGPYAIDIQSYAASRANSHYQRLADQKVQHDQVIAVNQINARQTDLRDQLQALASNGQDNTPEYKAAMDEWTANNIQKVQNPIFDFAPAQASNAHDELLDGVTGAVLTRHATVAYNSQGGGEAGKAEALRVLKTEALDDGGALSTMTPAKRLKLYGVAAANINDLDKYDAEVRRQKAEADRAKRADQRDYAGTLSLGLVDGTVSSAEIHQAERDGKIEPGAAAHLITSARAQARRDASIAHAGSAADRAANYGALSELAADGKLSAKDLAANGGGLTPAQRLALSARINKTIGPGVRNITALADAAFKDNGVQGTAAAIARQNLDSEAAQYMRNNPGATVGQQQAFAADWLKRNKDLHVNTSMSRGPATVQSRAQMDAAFRANFHSQTVTKSDLDANWKRYQATHPTAK